MDHVASGGGPRAYGFGGNGSVLQDEAGMAQDAEQGGGRLSPQAFIQQRIHHV
jgi:hypothetical protein